MKVPLFEAENGKMISKIGQLHKDRDLPLDRDIQVGDVVQDEVDQALQAVLAQVRVNALLLNQLPRFVGVQTILCKRVVSAVCHLGRHLLAHLDKVRARHYSKVNALRSHLL